SSSYAGSVASAVVQSSEIGRCPARCICSATVLQASVSWSLNVSMQNWPSASIGWICSQASYSSSQEVGGLSGSSPASVKISLFQYSTRCGSSSSGYPYQVPSTWEISAAASVTCSNASAGSRSSR